MLFYLVLLAVFATVIGIPEDPVPSNPPTHARQIVYTQQYPPVDLRYDFSLLDPQLQYPQFTGETPRLQPQVFVYPGGAPGQPFLLQPGAPPGNFLIPQPQPGFVLRDAPARPPAFAPGYPKPAYVPPINKDAEEIPTGPESFQPIQPTGRKPEKLETFDEKPEVVHRRTAGEADVLAGADRTPDKIPALKPGHRFFILNGQPLFSNYPLPQFANSPYQPLAEKFGPETTDFYSFRQSGPPFLPEGFSKPDAPSYKVPVDNFFLRNSVTGQINSAKQHSFENPQNDITYPQNFISLNQREESKPEILYKNLPVLPYKKLNLNDVPAFRTSSDEDNSQDKYQRPVFKLKPIEVPDLEDDTFVDDGFKESRKNKESISITSKPEPTKAPESEEQPISNKKAIPGISRSQPTALALAGPGGVAAAAPRATALTGEKGISVSSPHATAIAGPSRDQIKEKPHNKKER